MARAASGYAAGMGTGLVGIVVILVALVAFSVWTRTHRGQATPDPKRGLPPDRSRTWDPRDRYE